MYRDVWRLQREFFWVEDMSGVDWLRVYERYRPLVDRVSTRSDFSDLIWEMQGELGTSHAYEFGGDYRPPPNMTLGKLGAEFQFDHEAGCYRIARIIHGDPWESDQNSPLRAPGTGVAEGDRLLEVRGRALTENAVPESHLVGHAGVPVELTVAGSDGSSIRRVTVTTVADETPARYREWVEAKRRTVHERTAGKTGYVHIPDMGPRGYSEFHRYYSLEAERDSLIIDVRYNGGGHVSSLILEKLARKRLGYDYSRWGAPVPYPPESVLGPMVAVTNEHAGSDGDMFSHAFKMLKLGPLVGKRTWGGVIGISPRYRLVDGSITTQPEYSFWFSDAGWKLENYGAVPDIEVEITPQDYAAGQDPQLDKAIELILAAMRENPPRVPEAASRPRLPLPNLPKRG
jgi:tricorn protease